MASTVSGGFRKLDPTKLARAVELSLQTTGIMLEGEVIARANENVDTGRHKGSVTWQMSKKGSEIQPDSKGIVRQEDKQSSPVDSFEVHVGTALHYAPHLEYGHKVKGGSSTQPYPHFRDAFSDNLGKVKRLFSASFKRFIGASK